MTDTAIKKGTLIFVPNGERVRKLTVSRVLKGVPYAVFPGDKRATNLSGYQLFLNELQALRVVDGNLGSQIKTFKSSVSAGKKALKQDERSLTRFARARAKVRTQIKGLRLEGTGK